MVFVGFIDAVIIVLVAFCRRSNIDFSKNIKFQYNPPNKRLFKTGRNWGKFKNVRYGPQNPGGKSYIETSQCISQPCSYIPRPPHNISVQNYIYI